MGSKIVLFADDTNILVSGENINNLQYKLNNIMNEMQTWFTQNSLVVNVEKTLAMSFRTTKNKKPLLPHVIFEGRDIPYSTETRFLGIYINENMKWNNHIKHLSSKLNTSYYVISSLKNGMSPCVLRIMYFACVRVHLRYGLTLWGGDSESIRIFRLQKKVIRIIGKAGLHSSCRNIFKDLHILPLPCLYISKAVCCVKSNMENMKYNEEVHEHCTRQKSDLHTQFCRTTPFKNSSENVGIELYNKFPNTIKRLEEIQEYKRRLNYYLLQHIFYSVDEYMSS